MKLRQWLSILVLLALLLVAAQPRANAWGREGHAIVADIAAPLLTPFTRAHVATLLGGQSMASVSSWADDIREWQKSGTPPQSLAADPVAQAFVVPANSAQWQWHFADLPLGTAAYDPNGLGAGPNDIVHAMQRCIAILQTGRDPVPGGSIDSRQALRLLIHYTGDIHQPLHASCGYWTANPAGGIALEPPANAAQGVDDRGANLIKFDAARGDNLHALWDVHMVDVALDGQTEPAFVGVAVRDIQSHKRQADRGPAVTWPAQWIVDSAARAPQVYAGVDVRNMSLNSGKLDGFATVSPGYDQTHKALATRQLEVAGLRLANLLNAIWSH